MFVQRGHRAAFRAIAVAAAQTVSGDHLVTNFSLSSRSRVNQPPADEAFPSVLAAR